MEEIESFDSEEEKDANRIVNNFMGCITPVPMEGGFTASIIDTTSHKLIEFNVPKRSKVGYNICVQYIGRKRKAEEITRSWNREDLAEER